MKKLLLSVLAVSVLGIAVVAHADTPKTTTGTTATATAGEFGGHCAMGLALGKQVMTDCKITWKNEKTGKTYCFSSEAMKTDFAKNIDANLMKADANFKTITATNTANKAAETAANAATNAAKTATDAAAKTAEAGKM